jgi:leucyl aminopeptidase
VIKCLVTKPGGAVPITPLAKRDLTDWIATQQPQVRAWVRATRFKAEPGAISLIAGADGGLERVVAGFGDGEEMWEWAALASRLPRRRYRIDAPLEAARADRAALGWALAAYRFDRYRKAGARPASLVWPKECDRAAVERTAEATFLVRDLINTPASDMGPRQLAAAARSLARRHDAKATVIVGDRLLSRNFPAIHAVGRASTEAPRLIDLRWGEKKAPRVTLCGKGVCFDTGGLDLKSAAGMKLMKKDMGGAAHALGLAGMIMGAGLPVRLRVLIPAVENSVAGNAMRPLDVVTTRQGTSVEIGNTDAEGRVVLADALAEASAERPELLFDFATLTGAARVALGTGLPALFCNDDALAGDLQRLGETEADPVWRMPLWKPYRTQIKGKVADLTNAPEGGHGGAITAALFLEAFVGGGIPWAHLDLMAWNPQSRPGRPEGGEAMAMRAIYALIAERYGP